LKTFLSQVSNPPKITNFTIMETIFFDEFAYQYFIASKVH